MCEVDLDTIKTVAMWAIIVVAVIGLLSAILIKKIVGKIISLLVAAVLVFVAWQQRDKVCPTPTRSGDRRARPPTAPSTTRPPTKPRPFLGIGISLPDGWCTPTA